MGKNRNRRKSKGERGPSALDEHNSRCYYDDLQYLARLSFLPRSTRDWIEARMYELRASANVYEREFAEFLIKSGVYFIHQAPFVFVPRTIYFCDFYLPKERIAVEIDGSYHGARSQAEKDMERDANFKSVGIRVVRVSNSEVRSDKLKLRLSQFIGVLRS